MKAILLGLISIAAFTSCNTTIGFGRDMRVLGTEMERKAEQQQGGSGDGYSGDANGGGAPIY